jgi:hypothetical protein
LGSNLGATTVASGATLGIQGGISYTTAEPLSISGPGTSATIGALNNVSGANSFAGPITLAANSSIGVTAGSLTLTNQINGAFDLTKVGVGTLSLGASNLLHWHHHGFRRNARITMCSDALASGGVTVSGSTATLDLGADHIDTLGTVTVDGGGSILGTGTSALTTTGTFE